MKLVDGRSYPVNSEYQYLFSHYHPMGRYSDFVLNKDSASRMYAGYQYLRCLKMFKYNGLPVTIPQHYLEFYMMDAGSCCITKDVDGDLYAVQGTFGGEPDPYYRPKLYVVANPALKFADGRHSSQLEINKDCIIMRNDPMYIGLKALIEMYSYMLAENMLTIRTVDIVLRLMELISAPDDNTHIAATKFLDDLQDGRLGAIAENRFLEGIKVQTPTHSNTAYITQFIELHQYLKGSFYNDIGLESNYNMKRAQISSQETTLNKDALMPLVEIMLQTRKDDVKKVNELFGTNISVEFDSSWEMNEKEIDIMLSSELDPNQTLGQGLMEGETHERNDKSSGSESESHRVESSGQLDDASGSDQNTSETDDDGGAVSSDSSKDLPVSSRDTDEQGSDLSDASDSSNVQMTSVKIAIQIDTSGLEGGDDNGSESENDTADSDRDSDGESDESTDVGDKTENSSTSDNDDSKRSDG